MDQGHRVRLKTRYVFDAGPLSAFARADRLDILEGRYLGRAEWTIEVRAEVQRGVAQYPELQSILDAAWLGEPIRLTDPADLREIEAVRWALGGTPERTERHRGEAATIVLAKEAEIVAVLGRQRC